MLVPEINSKDRTCCAKKRLSLSLCKNRASQRGRENRRGRSACTTVTVLSHLNQRIQSIHLLTFSLSLILHVQKFEKRRHPLLGGSKGRSIHLQDRESKGNVFLVGRFFRERALNNNTCMRRGCGPKKCGRLFLREAKPSFPSLKAEKENEWSFEYFTLTIMECTYDAAIFTQRK